MIYKASSLGRVTVTDPYYRNALDREIAYLHSLDGDRLLAGFFESRGLVPKGEKYPGWETSEIQGHTLGHYLTALVQALSGSADSELREKLNYILSELEHCQHSDGFLFAGSRKLFDKVEEGRPAWVPWYTMHKIVSGLTAACRHDQGSRAWGILEKLAGWISRRTESWSEETRRRVLAVEYGGMNDCLYDVYALTGNPAHRKAAEKFDEMPLFEALAEGKDVLNDLHANTTIPKFLGALKRVMVTGEGDFYLRAAENFWQTVVSRHSYVTGGNSEWEHFGEPGVLDGERTNCTCETCNTYNMLKLSRNLFEVTGKTQYLHFYENTLNNAILPSQNPDTGMTMYFQPMATGYFKVYSNPYDSFWCCTGSGMENFTKLNEGICYLSDRTLIVGRYVSHQFRWEEQGLTLDWSMDLPVSPEILLDIRSEGEGTDTVEIRLVKPPWSAGGFTGHVVGESWQLDDRGDYLILRGDPTISASAVFRVTLELTAHNLPDGPDTFAFSYGPFVLSACLGEEEKIISYTGVDVAIPADKGGIDDSLIVDDISRWIGDLKNLKPRGNPLKFQLTAGKRALRFIPHYLQKEERYGIYWRLLKKDSPGEKQYKRDLREKERYEASLIDRLPLGNDQYELKHGIVGIKTQSGTRDGFRYREILPGGKVAYTMAVDSYANCSLKYKYSLGSPFRFQVFADGFLLKTVENRTERYLDYADEEVALPAEITGGKSALTVTFENRGETSFRLADLLITRAERLLPGTVPE
ncbi:MAG: glycoside hydrolase family 127 protein [Spirochaetales bacterium]|nr:glycoside hydrolase family 127 protein [Spirochaetales bacterium]